MVFRRNAHAAVRDADEHDVPTHDLLRYGHRRRLRRVVDGVGDEVGYGRDQQRLVSEYLHAGVLAANELDAMRVRCELVARNSIGDDVVDADRLHSGQTLGALQLGQRDELLDHVAHARGFLLDALAEVLDVLRVIRVLQECLGEQADAAHRGLQLMRDVGHEVAARCFHAHRLGLVRAVDDDKASITRSKRLDHGLHLGDAVARAALADGNVETAFLAVLEDLLSHLPHVRVEDAIVHERHAVRRAIGQHDVARLRHDDKSRGRSLHAKVEHLADGGDLVRGVDDALAHETCVDETPHQLRQQRQNRACDQAKNNIH